jgi:hypothetical protein
MNGRSSVGPRSRHINIRYFWIRDVTERNTIKIRHCLTLLMMADFFTKPLQGSLFRKFRSAILGVGEERTEATRADICARGSVEENVDHAPTENTSDEKQNVNDVDGFTCVRRKKIRKMCMVTTDGEHSIKERKVPDGARGANVRLGRSQKIRKDVYLLETIPLRITTKLEWFCLLSYPLSTVYS